MHSENLLYHIMNFWLKRMPLAQISCYIEVLLDYRFISHVSLLRVCNILLSFVVFLKCPDVYIRW